MMAAQLSMPSHKCSCGGTCGKCAPKNAPQPQQTPAVQLHAPQRIGHDFSRVPVHATTEGRTR
jgi:hypothetical protein